MWLTKEEEKEFCVNFSHVNISNNFSRVNISNNIKKRTLKLSINRQFQKRFLLLWGKAGDIKEVKTDRDTQKKKNP